MTTLFGYDRMRPVNGDRRGHRYVAHIFPVENRPWPWREALCGKELDGRKLIHSDGSEYGVCGRCDKAMRREAGGKA